VILGRETILADWDKNGVWTEAWDEIRNTPGLEKIAEDHPLYPKQPTDADLSITRRLCLAFDDLLHRKIKSTDDFKTFDRDRAEAVLLLTWLFTDEDAHQYPAGKRFGTWKADSGRKWARWGRLDAPKCRKKWMELAAEAWKCVGATGDSNEVRLDDSAPKSAVHAIVHPKDAAEFDRDLVTLNQIAGIVKRGKRTMVKHQKELGAPQVKGGGGKPSLWRWKQVLPYLRKQFNPGLPDAFPANRS